MATVYSVSQVNSYIKNMFAQDFALSKISVQGEVSNCKYHSSGHIYFTLKDSGGTLSAVMFASRRGGLSFALKDGMQVKVDGSIEVYEKTGTYQLYAQKITEAGLGDLYERFIKLRDKLEEMGMFADEYKQAIPKYVSKVGVVTASTGAAIQDIINITTRRNPYVQLILVPAQVQGVGAAESIANGIKKIDQAGCDVLIVGRGGGSIEDLWAFNEEVVARAIFDAKTPIISAVGHETDFTIADYVADLRAPTPSAAAELAVFDYNRFESDLEILRETLSQIMYQKIDAYRNEVDNKTLRLNLMSPSNRINNLKLQTAELRTKLINAEKTKLTDTKHKMAITAERLKGISPLSKLASGYAWLEKDGTHIKSINQLQVDEELKIRLADGEANATVTEITNGREK